MKYWLFLNLKRKKEKKSLAAPGCSNPPDCFFSLEVSSNTSFPSSLKENSAPLIFPFSSVISPFPDPKDYCSFPWNVQTCLQYSPEGCCLHSMHGGIDFPSPHPKRPAVSSGASGTASPAGWGKGLSLCCTLGVASLWVLCAVLGATIQERYKAIREHPKEAHRDNEGPWGGAMCAVPELTWLGQPGGGWGETSLQLQAPHKGKRNWFLLCGDSDRT